MSDECRNPLCSLKLEGKRSRGTERQFCDDRCRVSSLDFEESGQAPGAAGAVAELGNFVKTKQGKPRGMTRRQMDYRHTVNFM
jgi:hypothetical protein